MKKAIKLLSLVLALVMCLFAFAACGTDKDVESGGSETEPKVEKPTIVVGYTIYEPMNYLDANGTLVGFDTELAKKVFEELGYEVLFKQIIWADRYTALNSGVIDCIWNGFTCNDSDDDGIARSQKVDFSYQYMENQQAIVVKKGSDIVSASNLKNKIAAVEAGSSGENYAKGVEGVVIKPLSAQTDGLMEVNAGTSDFAVVDIQLAKSYCGKGDYANLQIVEGLSSKLEYYAIGFKKGSELTDKVNAQLVTLGQSGYLKSLGEKYKVANAVVTDFSSQQVPAAE